MHWSQMLLSMADNGGRTDFACRGLKACPFAVLVYLGLGAGYQAPASLPKQYGGAKGNYRHPQCRQGG